MNHISQLWGIWNWHCIYLETTIFKFTELLWKQQSVGEPKYYLVEKLANYLRYILLKLNNQCFYKKSILYTI